jgi:hypothetical protein
MSGSLSWIDNADLKRIRATVARSADVIAAARRDLEKHRRWVDRQPLTSSEELKLSPQPAGYQHTASAQRRTVFRRLLRTPDIVTARFWETFRRLRVDDTVANEAKNGEGTKSCADSAKRQNARFGRQRLHAGFCDIDNEELLKRDRRTDRRRPRQDQKTPSYRRLPDDVPSMPVSWTQRLDYLINVVTGALAATLLISWMIRASTPGPYADSVPVVANVGSAQVSGKQATILLEPGASLHPAGGFDILSKAFPEPLPPIAEDITTMLFMTRPSLASAPGVAVFPYTGLPQALPAFSEDIAGLMLMARIRIFSSDE